MIATSQVEPVVIPGSSPEDRRPRCRRLIAEILLLRFGMVAPSITTNSASGVDWPSWAHLSGVFTAGLMIMVSGVSGQRKVPLTWENTDYQDLYRLQEGTPSR